VNSGDPVFATGDRTVETKTAAAALTALGAQPTSGKGVANGYAGLGADGKVPDDQLPDDIGGDPSASIHAADTQATPVDADELGLVASASSWALRKFTWANVKSVLKTYFDGLYSALGHTHAYEPSNANIQSHVTGTGSPHTASGVGAEAANANIQSHVTGTGSPHTAAGVGADASGTAVGAVNAHNIAFDHTKLHAAATAGEGISLFGQQVTNTDLGSVAVTGHEEDFDHTKLHVPTTVTGNGLGLSAQDIHLHIGTGSTDVAAGDHGHSSLHTQGTDQGLDTGGTYAKTAQEIHDAVDLAHSNALDHAAVTVVGGNGLVLFGQQLSLDVGPEAAHVASGLHGHPASAISNTPAGNISATDVQAALNELDTSKREMLEAARTYYVRTDGNDANTGLVDSAGGAFLTIGQAMTVAKTLDLNGKVLTVQVRSGTYNENVTLPNVVGYWGVGSCILIGDTTTPTNVVVSKATLAIISANGISTTWQVKGFSVSSTANWGIVAQNNSVIYLYNMDFAACGGAHMVAQNYGSIVISTSYTVSAAGAYHFYTAKKGIIVCRSMTLTFSGTQAYSAFCFATSQSYIEADGCTFTGGTITGKRYDGFLQSAIYTNGGGANYFPGNAAGAVSADQYAVYL
jgi:hypothetical protein